MFEDTFEKIKLENVLAPVQLFVAERPPFVSAYAFVTRSVVPLGVSVDVGSVVLNVLVPVQALVPESVA